METALNFLASEITALETKIADLEARRQKLLQAGELLREAHSQHLPEATAPRSREQILRELISAAGQQGLSRHQIIQQMAKVCDSPPTSISTMLSRLATNGHVRNVSGRWISALRTAA